MVGHITLFKNSKLELDQLPTPGKPGAQTYIPRKYELQLAQFVQKLRTLLIKCGESLLIGAASWITKGTVVAEQFKYKVPRNDWYYSFRRRWGIKAKNQNQLITSTF